MKLSQTIMTTKLLDTQPWSCFTCYNYMITLHVKLSSNHIVYTNVYFAPIYVCMEGTSQPGSTKPLIDILLRESLFQGVPSTPVMDPNKPHGNPPVFHIVFLAWRWAGIVGGTVEKMDGSLTATVVQSV